MCSFDRVILLLVVRSDEIEIKIHKIAIYDEYIYIYTYIYIYPNIGLLDLPQLNLALAIRIVLLVKHKSIKQKFNMNTSSLYQVLAALAIYMDDNEGQSGEYATG